MSTENTTNSRNEFMNKPVWTDIDLINWFGGMIREGFIDRADLYIVQFDRRTPKYIKALLFNYLRGYKDRRKRVSYPSKIIQTHWELFKGIYNLPF